MSKTVTPELSEFCGVPVGTVMNADVMYKIGYAIGNEMLKSNHHNDLAFKYIEEVTRRGEHFAIITATITDLQRGVFDAIASNYNIDKNHVNIMGSEAQYGTDGTVSESVFVDGNTKTNIVKLAAARGGNAVFGAGDKPNANDQFIAFCNRSLAVDTTTSDSWRNSWQRPLSELTENDHTQHHNDGHSPSYWTRFKTAALAANDNLTSETGRSKKKGVIFWP